MASDTVTMPLIFRRVLPQNTIPTILLPEIDDARSYNENKLLEQEGHKDRHLAAHLATWLTCAKQAITHSCQMSSTAAAVNYTKNNKRALLCWELRLVWHVCRNGLEADNDQKVYLYLFSFYDEKDPLLSSSLQSSHYHFNHTDWALTPNLCALASGKATIVGLSLSFCCPFDCTVLIKDNQN